MRSVRTSTRPPCARRVPEALAFGRLGAILSAFAGAIVITTGGATAYLTMLAIAMRIVCVALLVVRRHIPRLSRAAAQPREGEELARTSS